MWQDRKAVSQMYAIVKSQRHLLFFIKIKI